MSVIYLNTPAGELKKPLIDFDFTDSLTDSVHNYAATLGGTATRSNSGVSLVSGTSKINLSAINFTVSAFIFTFEIDIGDSNIDMSDGKHKRFFMWQSNSGLIYRSTGYWGIYNNTTWYMTDISDKDYFKNSTVKIVLNNNKNVKLYKDNELIYDFTNIGALSTYYNIALTIGADEQAIFNMMVEGLRVY